ncbi:uncharacterized protein LOC106359378 [Brassica napus]|uniref:uncharacterized protein LOC106359378 n=1 Tax=Brassica napus TaxID=3708 RepID=UPI0006AA9AE9|nr:uncharacterized protein LOC106359378 [Brassica napus]
MAARAHGDFRVLGDATQDANMEDIGEQGRPPGDPPDAPGSWVRKVVGSNGGGMPVPEEIVDESFVESNLTLEFPDGEDGEPVITIGKDVLTAMNSLWKRCMIVKVLGRSVPLLNISKRLREMWKPAGSMHVMDLPRNFFMVRFELEEEYMNALSGGPWRAYGSYLMVQAWSPDFDPLRDEIVTTPVWVRLAHLPVNFYHKTILMGIAKGLGRPIKVDLTTLKVERAKFARICVEVNLNKPLKGTVMINGERYCVSYEGISTICSSCGMYGHLAYTCPRKVLVEAPTNVIPQVTMPQKTNEVVGMEAEFTPVRQIRQGQKALLRSNEGSEVVGSKNSSGSQTRGVQKQSVPEEIRVSNRFGGLHVEGEVEDQVEESERREENKENENNTNVRAGELKKTMEKEFSFGNNGNKENNQSARLGHMEKKIRNTRGPNVLKTKQKNVGPMRGLVFGPISGESGLSVRGKRLRVEEKNIGRLGGAFVGDGKSDSNEENSNDMCEQRQYHEQLEETDTSKVEGEKTIVDQRGDGPVVAVA